MSFQFNNLSVSYGSHPVINNLQASFARGTLNALVGPNGTGKSTLLKALAGLQTSSGEMRLDQCLLNPSLQYKVAAYMPQDISDRAMLSVFEVILLGRLPSLGLRIDAKIVAEAEAALDWFNLAPLAGRSLAELSGGQRQMVFLTQALFREPTLLLLDEPTAALDLHHQLRVLEAVRQHCRKGSCIVIVAIHDLNLAARFADRVLCLDRGKIVADGPPEEVFTAELIRNIYGVEAEVDSAACGGLTITPLRASPEIAKFRGNFQFF